MSLLFELRRRNVFKVAAGYALVAWILIEAGSVLLPTFGVPEWFFKVYVLIVFAGFLVAMIIAWVFEVTPDGVKLESDIDRDTYQPGRSSGINFTLIALLAAALVVSLSLNILGLRDTTETATDPVALTSVAVLPFDNRSADAENGFFADGLHDDLMDRLERIDSLRVISGTSVKAYRETTKTLRQIGEELGVTRIVEGSVQRSGDQIQVIVRVFDAETEERLFSDTYIRNASSMENVFSLQSEISAAIITDALSAAELTENQQRDVADIPTRVPAAFAAYTWGIQQLELREFSALRDALANFRRATELDPAYDKAYAKLAETIMVLLSNHRAMPANEAWTSASQAVDKALELDPELAEAYAVRGMIEADRWARTRVGDGNLRAAADFEKALALNPSLSEAMVWFSSLRENEDRLDDAIALLHRAIELNPLHRIPYINLPGLMSLRGDNDGSIALLVHTTRLFPDWSMPNDFLSQQLQGMGYIDEALAWTVRLRELSDDPLAGSNSLGIYRLMDREEQIERFTEVFPEDHPVLPVGVAYVHFIRGEYADALAILEPLADTDYANVDFYYPMVARAAVMDNQLEKARDYLLLGAPRLAEDRNDPVSRFNLTTAVLLGYVELQLGNTSAGRLLLEQALAVAQQLPRRGVYGIGILDARILTQLGRRAEALDAFAAAVDAGFVSSLYHDMWDYDTDPLLETLRDEPAFVAATQQIEARLAVMKANIDKALESGNWTALREQTVARSSIVVGNAR